MANERKLSPEIFNQDIGQEKTYSASDAEIIKVGKYDPCDVIAGSALVITILSDLLESLTAARKISIAINNYTGKTLTTPKSYTFSGGTHALALEIDGDKAGFSSAEKTSGPVATGTVGVVSYELEGTGFRLAIMYSTPFDYDLYSNWFKMAVINKTTKTDYSLYEDMYYNYDKKTSGNAW